MSEIETSARAKLAMVIASVALTLLLTELVGFRLLLPHLPLRLHVYLPEGIRPLAQSSKSGTLPHDYVALLGDSYAQGRGDWLLAADAGRNPPFHSAHVLHELSGRDVVSFARGGAGGIRGLVLQPISALRYLQASTLYAIESPRQIVAYFYAGNDLQDTLVGLAMAFGVSRPEAGAPDAADSDEASVAAVLHGLEEAGAFDPVRFREHITQVALPATPLMRAAREFGPADEFFFARFLANALAGEWRRLTTGETPAGEDVLWPLAPPRALRQASNRLWVGGRVATVTRELQGPGPELSAAETDAALYAYERSLDLLRAQLPETGICVVYVPSPAESYAIAGETLILQVFPGRQHEFSAAVVEARSRTLRRRLAQITARVGVRFVDATPRVREASDSRLLHGPKDWRHFNREGYLVLGRVASRCLEDASKPETRQLSRGSAATERPGPGTPRVVPLPCQGDRAARCGPPRSRPTSRG